MNETKLKQVIETSLGNIKEIVDVNTVVGTPIPTAGGTIIIPVSKVSMGFASGGADLVAKTPSKDQNFLGCGGTGVTLTPVGFLVTKADGNVQYIPAAFTGKPDALETIINFIESSPELIKKFKDTFAKDKYEDEDEYFEDEE